MIILSKYLEFPFPIADGYLKSKDFNDFIIYLLKLMIKTRKKDGRDDSTSVKLDPNNSDVSIIVIDGIETRIESMKLAKI